MENITHGERLILNIENFKTNLPEPSAMVGSAGIFIEFVPRFLKKDKRISNQCLFL